MKPFHLIKYNTFNNTGIDDVFPQSNEMIGRQVMQIQVLLSTKDGDFMCFSKEDSELNVRKIYY